MAKKSGTRNRRLTRKEIIETTKKIFKDLGPMTTTEFRRNKSIYRICNFHKFYIGMILNHLDWLTLEKEAGVKFKDLKSNIVNKMREEIRPIDWDKSFNNFNEYKKASKNYSKMVKND